MSAEIEREDCSRCGGSGQVMKSVAGRSGYVPCDSCDNVPEYAVPDDVPEDPEGRVEEIDAEIDSLRDERERQKDLRREVGDAKDGLNAVAQSELVDEETAVKLSFLASQVGQLLERLGDDRHYHYQREQLGREKAKLLTLLDHLEDSR